MLLYCLLSSLVYVAEKLQKLIKALLEVKFQKYYSLFKQLQLSIMIISLESDANYDGDGGDDYLFVLPLRLLHQMSI